MIKYSVAMELHRIASVKVAKRLEINSGHLNY